MNSNNFDGKPRYHIIALATTVTVTVHLAAPRSGNTIVISLYGMFLRRL
jgi:hypothetical protein